MQPRIISSILFRYSLTKAKTLVGRAPECDLIIHERSVSRRHAEMTEVNGGVRIVDLGSRFGTYIGHSRIQDRILVSGDAVSPRRIRTET